MQGSGIATRVRVADTEDTGTGADHAAARPAPPRTIVVCADPLYGRGMKMLLETVDFGTVFVVDSMDRACRMSSAGQCKFPEAVLWLVERFDGTAAATASSFRDARPCVGLCICAVEVDARMVRELAHDRAGFLAVMLRRGETSVMEVVGAIERVSRGAAVLEPAVIERMLRQSDEERRLASLTATESRVLEMLAAGLRNGEIALAMRRSEKAVEKHVSHIFEKLDLPLAETGIDRRVRAARLFHQAQPPPPLATISAVKTPAGVADPGPRLLAA